MKKLVGVLVLLLVAATASFGQVVTNEWQIPFLNALTGAIASIGEYLHWGANYAAEEINAAGGIAGKPVKIIPVDVALDPQKGSVEMARIVKDTLVALGPVPEPVIMAAMPIAVENGMMSITATTSYEYAAPYLPWTLSWFPPTEDRLATLIAAYLNQFNDIKTVVQFVEPMGPWPGMAKGHSKAIADKKLKEVKVDVPIDAVSFGPIVVRAMAQKPDAIILACNAEKAAKIIKELRGLGWKKMNHILVFSSADTPELYTTSPKDVEGVQIYNYTNDDLDTPRWNAFKKAYMADHKGTQVPSLAPNYYDAVYMIKEAIEKTGVTGDPKKLKEERKKIADYLQNVKGFKGLLFEWDNVNGVAMTKPTYIFEIRNGRKNLVLEVKPGL
ncbi:MAG: ABC transporter substrate-binding protein [Spirochaetia bacterium]|jgi:branched-chain amino acid transport system substrate-binding protein|uniref:Leu/Ile/Val-binding protein n=1 Tax=bioreactor metagenome TaxID=1076179 RepID=A0A644V4E3_9ZZZZ|nr:ABC transporter substrate-binding protein [Spirochaetia bacterium]MCE1210180.1 ABC transporter substrate-binding protein [Spirochaetia bacterium]VBB41260.1 Receptor family ligand-binding protein [uncultured Spirochaetota bacterium]HOI22595.1 ABC transporter substrate-binding protein [Spirochaetales bacterium]